MSLITILGIAAGVNGLLNDSMAKDNNKEAMAIIDRAGENHFDEFQNLQVEQTKMNRSLGRLGRLKLDIWDNEIKYFLLLYNKFKTIGINNQPAIDDHTTIKPIPYHTMTQMEECMMTSSRLIEENSGGFPTYALVGTAAYGTTLLTLQCMNSAAVLPVLTEAISKSACMSAFCSSALGGVLLSSSAILGPVMTISSMKNVKKSEENLENARSAKARMNSMTSEIKLALTVTSQIREMSDDYYDFLLKFIDKYDDLLEKLQKMYFEHIEAIQNHQLSFMNLKMEEKQVLHFILIMTQILVKVICQRLVNDDCELDKTAKEILQKAMQKSGE